MFGADEPYVWRRCDFVMGTCATTVHRMAFRGTGLNPFSTPAPKTIYTCANRVPYPPQEALPVPPRHYSSIIQPLPPNNQVWQPAGGMVWKRKGAAKRSTLLQCARNPLFNPTSSYTATEKPAQTRLYWRSVHQIRIPASIRCTLEQCTTDKRADRWWSSTHWSSAH